MQIVIHVTSLPVVYPKYVQMKLKRWKTSFIQKYSLAITNFDYLFTLQVLNVVLIN